MLLATSKHLIDIYIILYIIYISNTRIFMVLSIQEFA